MNTVPLLITLGDPAGIGPELVAQAWLQGALHDALIVGEPAVFERGLRAVSPAPGERRPPFLVPPPDGLAAPDWRSLPWGQVDAACGREAARMLRTAMEALRAGRGRALVTAPIHKEALALAGVPFPGHTEMLQAWAHPDGHPPPVRMMLANHELKVVLVTIHQSLRSAIDAITFDRVLETIHITDHALRRWGLAQPRIAVAGLNPHAGEGGLFGTEEQLVIGPAISAARAQGLDVSGPHAPDTVFMRARHTPQRPGAFDAVVAMTHDHGLIPVKYLGVEEGVNITLGLPFVRTSPDHGTAFDIAGRGLADPRSFLQALHWARVLSTPDAGSAAEEASSVTA